MTKKKILIIDDDNDILAATAEVLKNAGFSVEARLDAEVLGDILLGKRFVPDLFILDVLIAGTDGRELACSIRSSAITSSLPIIMISAHATGQSVVKDCGANAFLPKPYRSKDLVALVNKLTVNNHA